MKTTTPGTTVRPPAPRTRVRCACGMSVRKSDLRRHYWSNSCQYQLELKKVSALGLTPLFGAQLDVAKLLGVHIKWFRTHATNYFRGIRRLGSAPWADPQLGHAAKVITTHFRAPQAYKIAAQIAKDPLRMVLLRLGADPMVHINAACEELEIDPVCPVEEPRRETRTDATCRR